jgi:TetR/AcrR family transcriptional repressor of nem operon
MPTLSTKEKALLEGRALLQKHGYNGFSFQDIAEKLGIKKPSLYDHFASKDDLIISIIRGYGAQFEAWTENVAALSPIEQIRKVFDVFHFFVSDKRKVCPVLALAADFQGLSKAIQNEVLIFVERWLSWLEAQIVAGQRMHQIRSDLSARTLADFVYSQGMGAQFQARIRNLPGLTQSSSEGIVLFLSEKVRA